MPQNPPTVCFIKTNDGRIYTYSTSVYPLSFRTGTTNALLPLTGYKDYSCGLDFAIGISTDGKMYSVGSNSYYQTAQSSSTGSTATVTQIGTASNWNKVFCRNNSSVALDNNGQLYFWGFNTAHPTTPDAYSNTATPTAISGATGFVDAFCATQMTFLLKADGSLWFFGPDAYGWSGIGSTMTSRPLTRVGTDVGWSRPKLAAAANYGYFGAAMRGTDLYLWGSNAMSCTGSATGYYLGMPSATNLTPYKVQSDVMDYTISSFGLLTLKTNGKVMFSGFKTWALGKGTALDASNYVENVELMTVSPSSRLFSAVTGPAGFYIVVKE